jgi:hypothetical protein
MPPRHSSSGGSSVKTRLTNESDSHELRGESTASAPAPLVPPPPPKGHLPSCQLLTPPPPPPLPRGALARARPRIEGHRRAALEAPAACCAPALAAPPLQGKGTRQATIPHAVTPELLAGGISRLRAVEISRPASQGFTRLPAAPGSSSDAVLGAEHSTPVLQRQQRQQSRTPSGPHLSAPASAPPAMAHKRVTSNDLRGVMQRLRACGIPGRKPASPSDSTGTSFADAESPDSEAQAAETPCMQTPCAAEPDVITSTAAARTAEAWSTSRDASGNALAAQGSASQPAAKQSMARGAASSALHAAGLQTSSSLQVDWHAKLHERAQRLRAGWDSGSDQGDCEGGW